MNYMNHQTIVLTRRCRYLEEKIEMLEFQRDMLTDHLVKIKNLYPSEESLGTWIADDALRASEKMEDDYAREQQQIIELEENYGAQHAD